MPGASGSGSGRERCTRSRRTAAAPSRWHEEPGEGPVLEFEQLLKLSFAEHGSKADALATLAAARAWAGERNRESLHAARAYLADQGPFQDRLATNILVGRFLTDYYRLVAEWAVWGAAVVESWPDDPGQAVPDSSELEEIERRADW